MKKRKVSVGIPRKSFQEFAQKKLADPAVQLRVRQAKEDFERSGFPQLRAALFANTKNRIRVVTCSILAIKLPVSLPKMELVERCMLELANRSVSATLCPCAHSIADFGVAVIDMDNIQLEEVVLLKENSRDAMGRPCVAPCDFLQGLVVRGGNLVELDVAAEDLKWGELFASRKH